MAQPSSRKALADPGRPALQRTEIIGFDLVLATFASDEALVTCAFACGPAGRAIAVIGVLVVHLLPRESDLQEQNTPVAFLLHRGSHCFSAKTQGFGTKV